MTRIYNKLKPAMVFVITLCLLANLFYGFNIYADAKDIEPDDNPYKSISTLMNVIQLLRQKYVDEDKVTYERLINGALKGMLHELDPFSSYQDADQYKNIVTQTEGKFGGVGIVVTTKNKILEVVAPMEDTPGFRAGIQPGDIILKIDGNPTRNMSLTDCVNLMRGAPGTKVILTIYRKSSESTRDIPIERAEIKLSGIKGTKIIDNGIGYVRLTQFVGTTAEKLDASLAELKEKKLKGLIIDLRGNPGGLLNSAIEVCSRFLKRGELIVFTEGRGEDSKREYFSVDCDKYLDVPIVILVDGNSASAAEIVSGCLQDHKRAVLVGEKTFGKGSVQTVVPLADKSAVKFTTARYYTPSERVIHEHGIEPDISVPISSRDAHALARQRAMYPGVIKPKGKQWKTDIQLQRAVDILKGLNLLHDSND